MGLTLGLILVACGASPSTTAPSGTSIYGKGALKPWKSVGTLGVETPTLVSGYLGDQLGDVTSLPNGWGPLELNQSNGDEKAKDGKDLSLSGVKFAKGLGVHALSDLVFSVDSTCTRFTASVGIDDSVRAGGTYDGKGVSSVVFQVYAGADDTKLFDSGVMTQDSATQKVNVGLPAGATRLRLRVSDGGNGNAYDHADWADAKLSCGETPPVSTVPAETPSTGAGTGLKAEYYPNLELSGLPQVRTDAVVNFDYGSQAPTPALPGIGADNFSVRWSGQVLAPSSGDYTFVTTSDDGVRLWVNDKPVIDNWTDHGATEDRASVRLEAGQRYNIRLEYYERGGSAIAKLEWQVPGGARSVIPQGSLFPSASAQPAPAPPVTLPTNPPVTPPPVTPTTGTAGSSVDASGTIVVDGQRFFPFGFYGVNWREPFADRLQALKNIGESGFNTMLAEDISTNEFGTLLDEADRLKVKMLVGFPSLSGDNGLESLSFMLQTVEKYKAKPALLGWSLFDDSDDGRLTFDSLRQLSDSVKAKDPSHITFSTLTGYYTQRRADKAQWLAASDSSGLQMYPIDPPSDYSYDYGGNPLTESYNVSRDYVEAAERGGKAMIINSQTFRWERPGTRLPSKAELRNMVFGQLFAGAKGIVGFVYSQELFDRKDLWNELVAIKQDVSTTLNGPILNGRLTRKTSGDVDLNYAYWEYQGACYVGVLNTSYTQAKPVNLPLPANCTGAVSSPISRLPNTLQWSGSVLSGSVAASEVEVYRVGTP